jgi:hypothetical protein
MSGSLPSRNIEWQGIFFQRQHHPQISLLALSPFPFISGRRHMITKISDCALKLKLEKQKMAFPGICLYFL